MILYISTIPQYFGQNVLVTLLYSLDVPLISNIKVDELLDLCGEVGKTLNIYLIVCIEYI